jgi:hypothetical protein
VERRELEGRRKAIRVNAVASSLRSSFHTDDTEQREKGTDTSLGFFDGGESLVRQETKKNIRAFSVFLLSDPRSGFFQPRG